MPSVDNRVVRMEFDNATFEAKVKQTIQSLGQLDKALKLDGAHKGLTDISKAAGQVNLGPLQTSVQGVSSAFLALSTIAVTALSTITRHALHAASTIASSFTLDPIMGGFREFELQMGSIQTILANTRREGTQLSDVTAALDLLNQYADQTIYNFGQMTKNIGTFTAAGVDLDTSVQSIKGISNLAAISGSTAEQAASAMYQLSQAISTGTLRLIDWNSVVNAGMGGEVFQRALFETGVAMGTIVDAPVGTTFEEWTAASGSFRDSLEEGWLTSEVLTNTLKGFTGDMTEAQLLAIGYTKEQAAEILAMGQAGLEAATKVRTLTQLMTTLKEGLESGWAQSFRIILGDFEEATQLFTGLSNSIGGFFARTSEARNAVLQGWADLGGRQVLLEGLENAFHAIGAVLVSVGKAFRDIFPATTADRLFQLTERFRDFTASLKPSEQTIANVRRIATGLFAALDLGWDTIKAGVGFIKDLIVQLTGLGSGNYLEGAADIIDFFTRLRENLRGGEAIQEFFDNLSRSLQKPIEFIKNLREELFGFFESLLGVGGEAAGAGVDRIGQRFEGLQRIFERLGAVGDVLRTALEGIMNVLDTVGEAIVNWFQELGDKLSEAMDPGEFDAILDALNVSLLGGIGLLIAKFLRGGLNFDLGGGFFSSITESFQQLTGVLEAMQTSIRADALLKIAAAVGILAAAVLVLSLIDSAALTRALTAMAVGFAQLMGAFAVLNVLSANISGAVSFAAIAAGMILLSTALVILAAAVAILAQLEWSELLRGLTAVTVLLGVLTGTSILLSRFSGNMISAGLGITAMAIGLALLAGAVKIFATMSWEELARGLSAVAVGLVVIAGAMHLMPAGLALQSVGLVLVATALNILGAALKIFATMEWGEILRGLTGIAGGLVIIAGAMHLMPNGLQMLAISAGLILVGIALNAIGAAMKIFGSMSWGEIARGLVAMAGALLILAIATNAMSGALAGAAAIFVVSVALGVLAKVLDELADIPFGDLIKAIGAIAIALAVFGIAAALLQPVIPALLGLGVALVLIGGAFALFGVGALAVAKAFQILAEVGPEAAEALGAALEAIASAIPDFLAGLAEGILDLIQVFADAAGPLAEALGVLLSHLLDTIIELTPKFGELFLELIDLLAAVLIEGGPKLIEAGIQLLIALLQGIRENIGEITTLVIDIITEFLNVLAANMHLITEAGTNVLIAFIMGVTANIQSVIDAVSTLITTFITAVGNLATDIASAGTQALVDFLSGITNNLYKVVETVGTMITTFINAASAQAGAIIQAGSDAIIRFIEGIGRNATRVITAGVDTVIRFIEGIGKNAVRLAAAAFDVVTDFLNALASVIRQKSPELRAAGANIATAIADGITGGLASKARGIAESAIGTAKGAVSGVKDFLGIGSPSKVFIEIGQQMGDGMAIGLSDTRAVDRSAENMANSAVSSFRTILSTIADEMGGLEELNPTITPVLDLTKVQADAKAISGYIQDANPLIPNTSFNQAQAIATSPVPNQVPTNVAGTDGAGGVIFNQTINSPEELSTAEIYKQTRNQITLAKEELSIP